MLYITIVCVCTITMIVCIFLMCSSYGRKTLHFIKDTYTSNHIMHMYTLPYTCTYNSANT